MNYSNVKAVVFDLGGVLITPITERLGQLATWHGVAMEELLAVLMGPREVSTPDHPWHRAERGELPTAEMAAGVRPYAEAAGINLRGDEFDILLDGRFAVRDELCLLADELRAFGYTTSLLTNSFLEFRELLERRVGFGIFDHVIDSSEVGVRKPEPAIYELTSERLGVDPHQVLFLDDFAANLVGAADHGWNTFHVTDGEGVHRLLVELIDARRN